MSKKTTRRFHVSMEVEIQDTEEEGLMDDEVEDFLGTRSIEVVLLLQAHYPKSKIFITKEGVDVKLTHPKSLKPGNTYRKVK